MLKVLKITEDPIHIEDKILAEAMITHQGIVNHLLRHLIQAGKEIFHRLIHLQLRIHTPLVLVLLLVVV